jgi:hypothetical protein
MDVCPRLSALSCVGRGLCDRQITGPKEAYRVAKIDKKPPVCEAAKGTYKDYKKGKIMY